MRQAFQIRLGQLERRYQRQLVMEQRKNQANPNSSSSSAAVLRKRKSLLSHATQRRNSWHSYISSEQELDKLALPDEPRSGSSLGIDSDHSVEGSDAEDWGPEGEEGEGEKHSNNGIKPSSEKKKNVSIVEPHDSSADSSLNELPESLRDHQSRSFTANSNGRTGNGADNGPHYSTPKKQKEGLKGGAKSWKEEESPPRGNEQPEEPHLSPVNNELNKEEADSIDESAKKLIHHKMQEYRDKMMKYFQEKSEARICVIEEKYQKQIDEVRRKYNNQATEKLSHLTTRIKDLENMLDVQTLV